MHPVSEHNFVVFVCVLLHNFANFLHQGIEEGFAATVSSIGEQDHLEEDRQPLDWGIREGCYLYADRFALQA